MQAKFVELKFFFMGDKDPCILHCRYVGCRRPGNTRSQGFSSHGVDLIILEYSGFSTKRVNSLRPEHISYDSSSGVVVRSTGAYKRLSGHPAGPVLGWVARAEYSVPKHYTCQAVRSGFRESFSWLSIVVPMRRKIEVPPT